MAKASRNTPRITDGEKHPVTVSSNRPKTYIVLWNEAQRNAALEYFDQVDESLADPALLTAIRLVRNSKNV